MSNWERRTTAVMVNRKGEAIFSDYATHITIADEAAGEFVEVAQPSQTSAKIAIAREEWPYIRDAIEAMLAECRDDR